MTSELQELVVRFERAQEGHAAAARDLAEWSWRTAGDLELAAEVDRCLSTADDLRRRCASLLQDVVDLARAEAGVDPDGLQPVPNPLRVAACCGCVCGRCSHQGGEDNHDPACVRRFFAEEQEA